MKKMINLWMIGFLVASCSSHQDESGANDQENVELSQLENTLEGTEVIEDPSVLKNDSVVTNSDSPSTVMPEQMVIIDESGQEKIVSAMEGNDKKAVEIIAPAPSQAETPAQNLIQETQENVEIKTTPSSATYQVQKGDTLMWVAFKIYGDYTKWRHLAHQNAGVLKGKMNLTPGSSLEYTPPMEEFNWNPVGNPYLVKKGDTLGLISKDVYGVEKRWKEIFENNRPLIRDPNLIFAGFTLYYRPDNKEVASHSL